MAQVQNVSGASSYSYASFNKKMRTNKYAMAGELDNPVEFTGTYTQPEVDCQIALEFLTNKNRKLRKICDRDVDNGIDQSMSIYISKINDTTLSTTIESLFRYNNIGIIDRVDIVNQTYSIEPGIKSAFIHFAAWSNTSESRELQRSIRQDGFANINYDTSITWFTRENRTTSRKSFEPVPIYRNMRIIEMQQQIAFLKVVNQELEVQIQQWFNREEGEIIE